MFTYFCSMNKYIESKVISLRLTMPEYIEFQTKAYESKQAISRYLIDRIKMSYTAEELKKDLSQCKRELNKLKKKSEPDDFISASKLVKRNSQKRKK